jgi:hypothetical protein
MSLTETLKDKWNRLHCRLDGANILPSREVEAELKKEGWKTETQYFFTGVAMMGASGTASITTIFNPKGEKVSTTEQRQEYLSARRAAAERVYSLK